MTQDEKRKMRLLTACLMLLSFIGVWRCQGVIAGNPSANGWMLGWTQEGGSLLHNLTHVTNFDGQVFTTPETATLVRAVAYREADGLLYAVNDIPGPLGNPTAFPSNSIVIQNYDCNDIDPNTNLVIDPGVAGGLDSMNPHAAKFMTGNFFVTWGDYVCPACANSCSSGLAQSLLIGYNVNNPSGTMQQLITNPGEQIVNVWRQNGTYFVFCHNGTVIYYNPTTGVNRGTLNFATADACTNGITGVVFDGSDTFWVYNDDFSSPAAATDRLVAYTPTTLDPTGWVKVPKDADLIIPATGSERSVVNVITNAAGEVVVSTGPPNKFMRYSALSMQLQRAAVGPEKSDAGLYANAYHVGGDEFLTTHKSVPGISTDYMLFVDWETLTANDEFSLAEEGWVLPFGPKDWTFK